LRNIPPVSPAAINIKAFQAFTATLIVFISLCEK